jgi:hypothetical protein
MLSLLRKGPQENINKSMTLTMPPGEEPSGQLAKQQARKPSSTATQAILAGTGAGVFGAFVGLGAESGARVGLSTGARVGRRLGGRFGARVLVTPLDCRMPITMKRQRYREIRDDVSATICAKPQRSITSCTSYHLVGLGLLPL